MLLLLMMLLLLLVLMKVYLSFGCRHGHLASHTRVSGAGPAVRKVIPRVVAAGLGAVSLR